jgi:hypothetical protein
MTPPFSCFFRRSEEHQKLQTTVVYLVRSFRTYARIRSLTTGTFNRVVKDRIAIRLSGANSGLDGPATRANPAVLETLQTYVAAQHPVNAGDSQNFQRFSTLGNQLESAAGELNEPRSRFLAGLSARLGMTRVSMAAHYGAQRYGLPLCIKTAPVFRRLAFLATPKRKT